MSFATIIPHEFFLPAPATPDASNGTVSVIKAGFFAGQILVAWRAKGCKAFNANLAAARDLKNQGHGTYRPEAGGWVFAQSAVGKVLDKFHDLAVDDDVRMVTSRPLARLIHGTITQDKGQYLVCWGGRFNVAKDAFNEYLDAARKIKSSSPFSRGYKSGTKSWAFDKTAASKIIAAFPAKFFNHPAELLKDAEKYPIVMAPQVTEEASVIHEEVPDPLADQLNAAAEAFLSTM